MVAARIGYAINVSVVALNEFDASKRIATQFPVLDEKTLDFVEIM